MYASPAARERIKTAIREQIVKTGLNFAEAARRIKDTSTPISPTTISRFSKGLLVLPSERVLYGLDRAMGWSLGWSATLLDDGNWATREPIMTGDSKMDAELTAMNEIVGLLDPLDANARRRVLRWALERFGGTV